MTANPESSVVVLRVVASAIVVAMAASIVAGFVTADFGEDGRALLDLTWGVVTLVDIYSAFTVVWLWIAWREAAVAKALVWLVLVVTLGSLAIGAYVALAAFRSVTIEQVLLGARSRSAADA